MAKYNESVREIFGLNQVRGEVGIEIEMEGRGLIHGAVGNWLFHNDGSLRGEENAEYVLSQPISRAGVPGQLSHLFKTLKDGGAKIRRDSPNTSVHVHLNVQEWSIKKVYTFICVWFIFESLLLDWCGEERVGNLFCLRGSDAEVSLQRLASAVRYSRYNTIGDQEGLRYAALNYAALAKFGSLEFRSLAGVYDEDTINLWVRILLSLKDFASNYDSPPEIIQEYSRSGAEEFLHQALPGDLWKSVYNKSFKDQMQQGMRLIQGVAYCVNWEKDGVKKKVGPDDELLDEIELDNLQQGVNPIQIDPRGRGRPIRMRDVLGGQPVPPPGWNPFEEAVPRPPEPQPRAQFVEVAAGGIQRHPGGWEVAGHVVPMNALEMLPNGNVRVRINQGN